MTLECGRLARFALLQQIPANQNRCRQLSGVVALPGLDPGIDRATW